MWKSTRKEDEVMAPEPSPARPMQTPTPPVVRPVDPQRMEAPRSVDVATIGKSVIVRGELSGSEDLYVDGEVEGSVCLKGQSLTIGPNGRVRANLEARNVIVHGRVDGNIVASDRVDLRKSASLISVTRPVRSATMIPRIPASDKRAKRVSDCLCKVSRRLFEIAKAA